MNFRGYFPRSSGGICPGAPFDSPRSLLPRIYLYVNCIVKGGSRLFARNINETNSERGGGKNTRKDDRVTPISAGPSTRRMREKGEKGQLCHQKFQMGPPVPVCYPVHLLKSADFSSLSSLHDTSEVHVSLPSCLFSIPDLSLLLASPRHLEAALL